MARTRVELLLLVLTLTGTLRPVLVQEWMPVDEAQLANYYQTGQWSEPDSLSEPDNSDHDGDGPIREDEVTEIEGIAPSTNSDPFGDHGFQVGMVSSDTEDWPSRHDEDFEGEFVDAPPRGWTSGTSDGSNGLDVVCKDSGFVITLPSGPLSELKVLGSKDLLRVLDAPASCDYKVNYAANTLSLPFTGCNVKLVQNCKTDSYSLQLLYVDDSGQMQVATASCEGRKGRFDSALFPRATSNCPNPTTGPPVKAQNCAVVKGERVTCGQFGIVSSDCEKMGCCVDPTTTACYYPLDECTGDQHFVFALRHDSASIPVDPTKLVIPGSNCKPVIVNDKVAIFKFKVTECGARFYVVGETNVYMAEVMSEVLALSLKFGAITRTEPLKFIVECRYDKSGKVQKSTASVGYMVKNPTSILPSEVAFSGLYGVQLRIAKDQTYKTFWPNDHQPLRLLLGKPVYLELSLKSPKPDGVILVNYCIAYPRSAKNALVLVYEGCANPYDSSVSILQVSDLSNNRYTRRFVVKAFQFMDQKTNNYLDEEIYFMCSAEVCKPREKTCRERCFDGKTP